MLLRTCCEIKFYYNVNMTLSIYNLYRKKRIISVIKLTFMAFSLILLSMLFIYLKAVQLLFVSITHVFLKTLNYIILILF